MRCWGPGGGDDVLGHSCLSGWTWMERVLVPPAFFLSFLLSFLAFSAFSFSFFPAKVRRGKGREGKGREGKAR